MELSPSALDVLWHSAWVIKWILTVLAWKCYCRPKSVFQTAFDLFRPVIITRQCLRCWLKRNFDTKRFFSRRQSRHPKCISLPIPMSNSVTAKDGDYVLASMPTRIIASPRYIIPFRSSGMLPRSYLSGFSLITRFTDFHSYYGMLTGICWVRVPGWRTPLLEWPHPGKSVLPCVALPGFSGDVRRCQGEKLQMRLMRDCFR